MKWLFKLFMKRSSWSLPYFIFLLVFVVLPLILIGIYAFQDEAGRFTFDNFSKFISNPEAANTFVYSIGIAIITTILCIVLGYPAAYILSNRSLCRSRVMVVLFILPMWINILVRTLATVALFDFMHLPLQCSQEGPSSLMTGEMGHMLHTYHTVLKNQLKNGLKPWTLRPETVKLLEEDAGESFMLLLCAMVFWI